MSVPEPPPPSPDPSTAAWVSVEHPGDHPDHGSRPDAVDAFGLGLAGLVLAVLCAGDTDQVSMLTFFPESPGTGLRLLGHALPVAGALAAVLLGVLSINRGGRLSRAFGVAAVCVGAFAAATTAVDWYAYEETRSAYCEETGADDYSGYPEC